MNCPPVRELAEVVERGEIPARLSGHLAACHHCQDVVATLRNESEGLSISIGDLWIRERISCPHPDILLAFVRGALDVDESNFIEFHLKTVGCAPCAACAAEFEDAPDRGSKERVASALEKSLEKSRAYLGKKR